MDGAAIPALRSENLMYLAFVIARTPEVMRPAIDPDEHLVQVPGPLGKALMTLNALLPYLSGKYGTEPVPLERHRFVTDIDTALDQEILTPPE